MDVGHLQLVYFCIHVIDIVYYFLLSFYNYSLKLHVWYLGEKGSAI